MQKTIIFSVINDLTYDQRMIRICRTLSHAGYRVILVGRKRNSSLPLNAEPFKQHRMRLLMTHGPLFYLEYQIRLCIFLFFHRADIYSACDLDTALPHVIIAWLKRKPCVFDAHEYFTEVPELAGRHFVKAVWSRIGHLTMPHFQFRYTVSTTLAGVLTKKYGVPFSVVRNMPVKRDISILPIEERGNVILYQGALNAGRGIEQAIQAMPYLPEYRLVLAGEGDLSHTLRALVSNLGLENQIQFLGKITPADLPELTRTARLGLNLLASESKNYYYSLSNKFFDYLHAGVPSVNMDFPEYRKLLQVHTVGITIQTLEPAKLAEALRNVLEDEAFMRNMVASCNNARDALSWDTERHKLLDLYKSLSHV